jgi:predicted O-methyltransferase YrrM
VTGTAADARLASTLADVRDVEGWLSDDQAELLWRCASRLGGGSRIVEIGSFRGRSTIVLARAASGGGGGGEMVAIDPHAGNDRGPREIEPDRAGGEADFAAFNRNLRAAGVADAVRHVRLPSAKALGSVGEPIDLLYVDGAHRYGPARDDIERWGRRVARGGDLLIHDSFSSIGVTLAQLRLLVLGREFRYLGRARSLAHYRRERLGGRERLVNALRQAAQLPWFARNVAIKVALVTRLRPLARGLGHRDGPWPY